MLTRKKNSVSICSLVQIAYVYKGTNGSRWFLNWRFILLLELIEYLGITTACGYYLKPLLESMSSGMLRSDDLRRRTQISSKASSTPASYISNLKRAFGAGSTRVADQSSIATENELLHLGQISDGQPRSFVTVTVPEGSQSQLYCQESPSAIQHTISYQVSSGSREEQGKEESRNFEFPPRANL
jgi:hypothetical protein